MAQYTPPPPPRLLFMKDQAKQRNQNADCLLGLLFDNEDGDRTLLRRFYQTTRSHIQERALFKYYALSCLAYKNTVL